MFCSEETSNNRVRSGSKARPIDTVPYAGARTGTADGVETTAQSLAAPDLEIDPAQDRVAAVADVEVANDEQRATGPAEATGCGAVAALPIP